jgi:hypothetical protein
MKEIVIVTATGATQEGFRRSTPLGLSIGRMGRLSNLRCVVACENRAGLPEVYNRAITEAHRDRILLFIHDDVFLDDFWLAQRLNEAVATFDLVGLAGNVRVAPEHVSWAFSSMTADGKPQWDLPENLSGGVCHRVDGNDVLSFYGPTPRACELLDGLFLAAPTTVLLDKDIRFDSQFSRNFYDLDFCRTGTRAGLKVGTWPIAATHTSGGRFGSPEWRRELSLYQQKWS